MLVVEGPDMVGKTTAIDRLVARGGLKRDKCGLPEAKYIGAKPWIDRIQPWTIMDRFTLSEPIYGFIARGVSNLTPAQYAEVDIALTRMGGMTVVVCATPQAYDVILERHYDPAREAFSKEICRKVNGAYVDCTYKVWHWRQKIDRFWRISLRPDGTLDRPTDAWWDEIARVYCSNQAATQTPTDIIQKDRNEGDREDD